MQLGDDLPSHILVPAIHRNRAEIRRDLPRAHGRRRPAGARDDLTDEPARLAEAARLHLREKFLRAKVGVSGANFAVADTGTLVVVESEGNGRMCLTLPEVLVSRGRHREGGADLGGPRRVPAAAAALLDRGADEPLHLDVDRASTPGDGPQEVHVVLLDNGRTRALADEVGRQALRCIRCSACLNVCPVYERTGGHAYGSVYPGPIGAILNPLLKGVGTDEQTDSLPYASSLCGACFEVCPVRIDIPSVLVDLRAQVVDAHRGGRRPKPEALAMKAAALAFGSGAPARRGRAGRRARRPAGPRGPPTAPGGRRLLGRLPGPGCGLDRRPRPAGAAARSRSGPGGGAPRRSR